MHWQVGRGQSVNLVTCDRTAEECFFSFICECSKHVISGDIVALKAGKNAVKLDQRCYSLYLVELLNILGENAFLILIFSDKHYNGKREKVL